MKEYLGRERDKDWLDDMAGREFKTGLGGKWDRSVASVLGHWEIFKRNRLGLFGLVLLIIFAAMALLSFIPPLIDPMYEPMTGVDPDILWTQGPTRAHWLGTDFIGRDILSQLLVGARIAFLVGITAAFMAVAIGTSVGLISGYRGKKVDMILMRVADIIMVMPGLLVILILSAVIGKLSVWNLVIIIGFLRWAGVARVIRSQTLSLRERPYVQAAIVSGASKARIIFGISAPMCSPSHSST